MDPIAIGALIGAVLPLIISVVQQPQWSTQQRQIAAIIVSIVAGIGTVLVSGEFSIENWALTIVAVIGAAQASYALIFKPSHVAEAVELKTTRDDSGDLAA